ncbi:sel1 repeat family protein [Halomonas sp. EGI 63088]|uniref:Sel1 repeat family protein n=1 Tax=Halomonas flagellata TaxID=2920385 RepID=A0ABS9RTB7_9GAMM|nr:tetratricopeptide repeat protein [Halomonas flagellata]MCH4563089.1 sel1 repeat family protein [Halomonas flagellata]
MLIKTFLAIALLVLSTSSWALEPAVQAAKDEGMRLWGISEWIEMQPYLEQAADAGDVEAMYYLGEATRLLDRGLSQRAMAWYLQAAEQNDVYAMLRLFQGGACIAGDVCPEEHEDWREAALAIAKPQAEAGDPDAMLAMFHVYRMFDQPHWAGDWLERAAEAGQPEAQTILGNQTLEGRGWYLTNGRRLSAAEEWLRKAVDQEHVPAMVALTSVLEKEGEYSELWSWGERASLLGSRIARVVHGECLIVPERAEYCRTEADPVQGWAMLYAVVEETGDNTAKHILEQERSKLTLEELEEAKALAEREWIGREPPLSNFPPRFGY